ncbi:MAG: 5-deoxy-glucuronate isomerase [Candidatus Accumulibacter sp.]|jgi:5-deoxy-glucuronate isomerase|nr:5-deoxy-glucuronate isomerase [Accumulibacter sp.]
MFERFAYPEYATNGEKVLTTREGIHRGMLMDIRVYRMKAGETREFRDAADETALLLLTGEISFAWESGNETRERASVFNENPSCLHLPHRMQARVTARVESELLVQRTQNPRDFAAKFYGPDDCACSVAGEGLCGNTAVRAVRTVFDYANAPYSNMVLGEVVGQPGSWSSYIPHHHPQPEVYYYQFERPEGFGACFIGESAFKIRHGSFCAIPGGLTHPQVSAPGYRLYTCWMIRHLDGHPWTQRVDDPEYAWLLDAKN